MAMAIGLNVLSALSHANKTHHIGNRKTGTSSRRRAFDWLGIASIQDAHVRLTLSGKR